MSGRSACIFIFLAGAYFVSCKTDHNPSTKSDVDSSEISAKVASEENQILEKEPKVETPEVVEEQKAEFQKIVKPQEETRSKKSKPSAQKPKKKKQKPKAKKNLRLPKIEFKNLVHDFGIITEGDTVDYEFVFENNGKSDLNIEKADPTCGCARPSFSFLPIRPGAKGVIGVKYISINKEGEQNPEITVYSDGSKEPIVLQMLGYVEKRPPEEKAIKIDSLIPDTLSNKGY